MSGRTTGAILLVFGVFDWFARETVKTVFFDRVVHTMSPHINALLEYGPPLAFMGTGLYLLWKSTVPPPQRTRRYMISIGLMIAGAVVFAIGAIAYRAETGHFPLLAAESDHMPTPSAEPTPPVAESAPSAPTKPETQGPIGFLVEDSHGGTFNDIRVEGYPNGIVERNSSRTTWNDVDINFSAVPRRTLSDPASNAMKARLLALPRAKAMKIISIPKDDEALSLANELYTFLKNNNFKMVDDRVIQQNLKKPLVGFLVDSSGNPCIIIVGTAPK